MQYQLKQLEQLDYPMAPDDPVEGQLASVMARISELQSRKQDLRVQILTATRELEIKSRLLRNMTVRERELRVRF